MTSIRTVIFDLDGTLTDPGEGITRCIATALDEHGLPAAPLDVLHGCIGPPLRDSFADLGGRPHQIEPLIESYRRRYRDIGIYENELYEGIPDALGRLRESGLRLHVATSKPTSFAETILDHFGLSTYFDEVVGSNLDGTRSEKHEIIAHVIERAGIEPGTTAMVGDRRFDLAAAREHGLYALGVLWGYGSEEELRASGAHALADEPSAIPAALVSGE